MKTSSSSCTVAMLGLLIIPISSNAEIPYNKSTCQARPHLVPNPSPNPDPKAPEFFLVEFLTTASIEPIIMEVNRSWAPIGVDRFYSLIEDNYYDCAAFFRVVPDFVVQFGIASDPVESLKWNTTIEDDPVLQSNLYSYVSYATAGPNTRTTQIFINLNNSNTRLDDSGFAPFGKVVSGMETVESIYNPTPNNSDGLDQDLYMSGGNAWILQNSSKVDIIIPSDDNDPTSSPTESSCGMCIIARTGLANSTVVGILASIMIMMVSFS